MKASLRAKQVRPAEMEIFRRYSIEELANRLGRTETYIVALKSGTQPIREGFREWAERRLEQPSEVLFGPAQADNTSGKEGEG